MTASDRHLTVAVVGCGMAGREHIAGLRASGGIDLVVCDVDGARIEEYRNDNDVRLITADWREVVVHPQIDAVVISTPPHQHAAAAVAAIDHGKHVLVDKPLATRLDDVDRILAAAAASSGLVVMDGSARHARLHEKYRRVRSLVAEGAIGEVYAVVHRAVYHRNRPGVEYHPAATWFTTRAMAGGGPLLDWGVYDLAFHFGVLGRFPAVREMTCVTRGGLDDVSRGRPGFDVEEHGIVSMVLDGDVAYYWERASNAQAREEHVSRFFGTRGSIVVSYPSWYEGGIEVFTGSGVTRIETGPTGEAAVVADHQALDAHFLDCVRQNHRAAVPLEEAAAIVRIIAAAYARAAGQACAAAGAADI